MAYAISRMVSQMKMRLPGNKGRYLTQETADELFMIAVAIGIVGWAIPNQSQIIPNQTSQCLTGYFGNNVTFTNGTLTLFCSTVGWNNLTNFPSGCGANQFVISVGASLGCAVADPATTSQCIGGQVVYNVTELSGGTISVLCQAVAQELSSSVKCTTGQFVTNVTESSLGAFTILCTLPSWANLTNFPAGCSAGSFVTTIGTTLTCGTPSQETGATVQCTSGQFAFNVTEAVGGGFTLGCAKIDWSSLQNFPSGCSAGAFVTAIGTTLT